MTNATNLQSGIEFCNIVIGERLPRSRRAKTFRSARSRPGRTRYTNLDDIETHHHVVVFVFEVVAVHQIAAPIAVKSHDDANIVANRGTASELPDERAVSTPRASSQHLPREQVSARRDD